MKNKRFLIAAVSCLMLAGTVSAQDYERGSLKSFSYVEAQGGVQLTCTNAPMDKLITPTAALSFGHYFTPVVGARLHVNAWQSKSGFASLDQYYKWKYVTPDIDLMINLSNMFSKSTNHWLNVILLGGVGLNYAWDNDDLKALNLPATIVPQAWGDDHFSHNLRAGLRFETNQQKTLGLSLEFNANSLDDRFNSKVNDQDDWMFTAMLGLSVRFGKHYAKKQPTTAPVVQEVIEEQVAETAPVTPVVAEKKKVQRVVTREEPIKLHKEVFYKICVSQNETPNSIMEQVAQFMKDNKNAKITIVGYADRGTGNARVNKMYAQRRAEQFKRDLVERYGVDASAITTDSKGDTVQPFEDNDKNRCVIIDGEAVRVYKETIEVEE